MVIVVLLVIGVFYWNIEKLTHKFLHCNDKIDTEHKLAVLVDTNID